MNVSATQHSLFRQLDAAAMVALQQQAAEQAQRQEAIHARRLAEHAAASVAGASELAESRLVGERRREQEKEGKHPGAFESGASSESPQAVKESPNPGPAGHILDIIG